MITLTKAQNTTHSQCHTYRHAVIWGNPHSGKTILNIVTTIEYCRMHPNTRSIIFGNNIFEEVVRYCDSSVVIKKFCRTITFTNGSILTATNLNLKFIASLSYDCICVATSSLSTDDLRAIMARRSNHNVSYHECHSELQARDTVATLIECGIAPDQMCLCPLNSTENEL